MAIGKVGFVGLGVMGRPMALNLVKAGCQVRVFDRRPDIVKDLENHGAIPAASVGEAAAGADVVVTMLPDSPDVEAVVLGSDGMLKVLEPGCVVVDMSTISPGVVRRIAAALHEKGMAFLDAPVSGGQKGARTGTLSIMVGGKRSAFEAVLPLFEVLGETVNYVGPCGMGQTVKLCNQIVCAMNIQAISEAFALGKAAGADLEQLREVLLGGAASSWMLENLGPQMISGDVSAGFRIDLHLKDLRIALETAFEQAVPTPGASLVTNLYLEARAHGEGGNGNQSLFRVYDRLSDLPSHGDT